MQEVHQLIIREPQQPPRSFALGKEDVMIGRSRNCNLRITDSRISREHCLIRLINQKYFISDLASKNGFRINGIPEKEVELKPNDRVTIGFTSIIYMVSENHETGIMITGDEPNETFSFTLELNENEVNESIDELKYKETLNILDQLLVTLNSESKLDILAESILKTLQEKTPATDCAIALYLKKDLHLIKEFKTNKFKLKIASKTMEKLATNNEAMHLSGDGDSETLPKLILPLINNDEILCLLILIIDEREFAEKPFLQTLFRMSSRLIATAFQREMVLDSLRSQINKDRDENLEFDFIGDSELMKSVYQMIRKVSPVDITVLITGESGTGKELVAKALHRNSNRKDGPFITINCGAIPVNLIESELFGHEKGSFTGAVKTHTGCFEQANDGILFLDEIGELEPNVQVKLLRALETRTIRRVGGTKDVPINIRVVAATHRNLEKMVKEATFREDLYFRLQVIEINMPPLRQRRGDIKLLSEFYIDKIAHEFGRLPPKLDPNALLQLEEYSWPGNVRELKNAIERALVLTNNGMITESSFYHLTGKKTAEQVYIENTSNISKIDLDDVKPLKDIEKSYIFQVLNSVNGNKKKAADLLGIERKTLYNKLTSYQQDD